MADEYKQTCKSHGGHTGSTPEKQKKNKEDDIRGGLGSASDSSMGPGGGVLVAHSPPQWFRDFEKRFSGQIQGISTDLNDIGEPGEGAAAGGRSKETSQGGRGAHG
eukprot:8753038-Pyramimonas_sp.AAC.1